MTAILLAAGVGKRMAPPPDSNQRFAQSGLARARQSGGWGAPKCLLSVDGKSLLRRILESLRDAGVKAVVLVVGHEKAVVIQEAQRYAGSMELKIVENPRFQEGAILSLWSAREFLNRPVLIMDTDVLVPPAAFYRLVYSQESSCILIDPKSEETGEEQMVFGEGGRVLMITKFPPEEVRKNLSSFGEAVGFLKLSAQAAGTLKGLLNQRVEAGQVDIEHEQVYPDLFAKCEVGHLSVEDLYWTEIDTPEDWEWAQKMIYPRWSNGQCINRVISDFFLPWVMKTSLTPNQWTLVSLTLGLFGVAAMAQGTYGTSLLGAILFQFFYIVDNWDGAVARAKGISSEFGSWLDIGTDGIIQVMLPLGLAAGLIRSGAPAWVLPVGTLAAAGVALDFGVTAWAKLKGFGPSVHGERSGGVLIQKEPSWRRFWRINRTNENFSLLVLFFLLLRLQLLFLAALAIGSQVFWVRFLWKERARLIG